MPLTKRQEEILNAIIQEFMDTAEAVGSLTLSDKYGLGISPATLRSEMSDLVHEGYLFKEHSSAGRKPTTLGIRYFLDQILSEEELDKIEETKCKEKLFQKRFNRSGFMKEAVRALSELSGLASLSIVDDVAFYSGLGRLLNNPEFEDLELLHNTLEILESESVLSKVFEKFDKDKRLRALVGDEIGVDAISECGIVYSPFRFFRGEKGYIGVIGPRRMDYSRVIPAVRIISEFIEDAINGWK